MHPHHTQSIQNVTDFFQRDPEVLALVLGGSIAHGFETPTSDVDIMIVVSDEDHKKRLEKNQVHFFNRDLCTYEGGYVDGKYLSLNFIEQANKKEVNRRALRLQGAGFYSAGWMDWKRKSARWQHIPPRKKPRAPSAFMPNSKHGIGIVRNRYG